MSGTTTSKPRRRPKQARSRAIVEAIEQAGARILVEQGPDALNTNRIAEVAGVNIASVYRYFPNKDAIVAELYERQLEMDALMLDALHDRAEEIDALSLEGTIRLLVVTYTEHRARLVGLHEEFYRRHSRELDLGDRTSDRYHHSWHAQSQVWLSGVLVRDRASLAVADPSRASALVLGALRGVINAVDRDRTTSLVDAAFREDVVRMLLRYLRD